MQTPLISIIIPVYNVEKYLSECLDSVIAQTYQNWEAICVNDGSPDNCGAILDQYASTDPRIKVIHKENEGTAIARTIAINSSKGEFITFLDSDDAYAPSFLEDLYNTLYKTNADVVWCDRVGGENLPTWQEENVPNIKTYKDVFHKFISRNPDMSMCLWNKLYKKELFQNTQEIPPLPTGQDLALLYQLMYNAQSVSYIAKHLYFYRKRPNSSMTLKFSQRNIDGIVGLQKYLHNIFKLKNLINKTRKVLEKSITKTLFKICIEHPVKKDNNNIKQWYSITIPLLNQLELDGIYQPRLLPINYKIKFYFFKIIKRI
ncbi:MAG: glycosyltransferase family 2 protein [Alphaproteobacteria bacterium]|nr:glycosyltransferase family 2 protein [Alphaproteobacteria bacterium]